MWAFDAVGIPVSLSCTGGSLSMCGRGSCCSSRLRSVVRRVSVLVLELTRAGWTIGSSESLGRVSHNSGLVQDTNKFLRPIGYWLAIFDDCCTQLISNGMFKSGYVLIATAAIIAFISLNGRVCFTSHTKCSVPVSPIKGANTCERLGHINW